MPIYFTTPTVSTTRFHATFSSKYALFSSCYPSASSATKSDAESPCFGQHSGSSGRDSNTLAHVQRHRITAGIRARQFSMQYRSMNIFHFKFCMQISEFRSYCGNEESVFLSGGLEVK